MLRYQIQMLSDQDCLSPMKHNDQEIDRYNPEVLETSVRKSYIYKLASKGGRRRTPSIDTILEEEKLGMLRSCLKRSTSFVYKSGLFGHQNAGFTFTVYFSNMGKPADSSFNCCQYDHNRMKAEVTLNEIKQLQVKNMKGEELYLFNFNTVKGEIIQDRHSPEIIIVKVSDAIILKMEQYGSKTDFQKFKKNLRSAVKKGLGTQYQMNDLLSKPGFQKIRYKPATEFAQQCQTGDILLFQASHFFASVQRAITNSQYDHVGMVIRDPVYGILIFESNSTSGVCLTPWDLLIKYEWYKYIERIVWRRLDGVERDMKFLNLVHEFTAANLGKNYYISLNKIMTTNSFVPRKEEEVGFFCSELVAALYKDLLLLTRNPKDPRFKPSSTFYPYHFTQKFKLQLEEGHLSPEYLIHFHPQELNDYYSFDH